MKPWLSLFVPAVKSGSKGDSLHLDAACIHHVILHHRPLHVVDRWCLFGCDDWRRVSSGVRSILV